MSHTPSKSVLRPNPRPLDKQMEALDRSTRQNAKATPVKMSTPKRPTPR